MTTGKPSDLVVVRPRPASSTTGAAPRSGPRQPRRAASVADPRTALVHRIGAELPAAIARGDFHLLFQPIFRASDGAPAAFEALLRWEHATLGPIEPEIFIPIAERLGLERSIGRWVLRTACLQYRAWQRSRPDMTARLSLNVSAEELLDRDFVHEFEATLDTHGLHASVIDLEITETVALRRSAIAARNLLQLRSAGTRIALDDFGTGYSNLSSVDFYPVDLLKIDRSFVARVTSNLRTRAVVDSIVRLAGVLGAGTVAEGIENAAQHAACRDLGCNLLQGFHLSGPLAPQDCEPYL